MRRLRSDSGFALIGSLMLVLVMLGFGAATVALIDNEIDMSRKERTRESSFNLAEAALGAHALQLSRNWPGTAAAPPGCDPASVSAMCPEPNAVSGGYNTADHGAACASTPATPAWRTVVRDNAPGELYWTTAVNARPTYDLNGDGVVWLRSTASAQCQVVSVVAQATRSQMPTAFPANVVTANWFATNNQGRKVIVDTVGAYAEPPSIRPNGTAAKPGSISVRCTGLTQAQCLNYETTKGQVQPPAVRTDPGSATSALSSYEVDALVRQAKAAGTYFATGSCPTTAAQMSSVGGAPVVVQGPCNLSLTGGTVNSSAAPGALVVINGTMSLGGNTLFYGLLYMLNQQSSTGAVLTISGNATLQGAVAVDGNGGVVAGASKTNLIYDSRAANLLRGDVGANVNKNTFRVLPRGTP